MENLEKVNSLLSLIHDWVVTKGLHTHEPLYQLAKLNEEFGELNKAVLKNDTIKIIDGIGDVLVVCTVMAAQFYNGGGHLNASGGRLNCTIEEAVDITRRAIEHYAHLLK